MTIQRILSVVVLAGNLLHGMCAQQLETDIEIRQAVQDDLQALLALDRQISFEYFKPLWIAGYLHTCLGQNPDYYLEKDLENDIKAFSEAITMQGKSRLHVANDSVNKKPVGLLLFNQVNETTLMLDLLMVDVAYRGKGIGRRLIESALPVFQGITVCEVYTLQSVHNQKAHTFYENFGFKRIGVGPAEVSELSGIMYTDLYFHYRYEVVPSAVPVSLADTRSLCQPAQTAMTKKDCTPRLRGG